MPLCPSAPLKFPARESKVGHLKTRGYLENSPHQGSVLLACFAAGFDIVRVTVGKFLIAFFLFSPVMDNNSFSEANFPGKHCLFSASSLLSVLSALSQCPMLGSVGSVSRGAGESLLLPILPSVPSSPHPTLVLPFLSRCRREPHCLCLERWGEQHLGVIFLENRGVLALDAFVDQSRRTGFHLDPADPSAQRFREVERAGSREVSWEPTKADHQRCLVFAGSRTVERLNDSKRMFHLKEVCFPAWLCISNPRCAVGPARSPKNQSAVCLMDSRPGIAVALSSTAGWWLCQPSPSLCPSSF